MSTTTEPIHTTVLDEDLGLTVTTDEEGTVILAAELLVDESGWHFTPDEARRLAGALLRHSGQLPGMAAAIEDDDVYWHGPGGKP